MIQLLLGLFLLNVCIFALMFGSGGIGGILGVGFVIIISLWLIIVALKKIKKDKKTSKVGEKCYARILECKETGTFFLSIVEYKVIVAIYVPSLQKRIITEEIVGYNKEFDYPKDSYYNAQYGENDINILDRINELDLPGDVQKILTDEKVKIEYDEYVATKQKEQEEKEKLHSEKGEAIANKINVISSIITIAFLYIFSILAIFLTSYISTTRNIMQDFTNNLPLSIIYPLALIINLTTIIPAVISPIYDKRRDLYVFLWFISVFFIMFQAGFINVG